MVASATAGSPPKTSNGDKIECRYNVKLEKAKSIPAVLDAIASVERDVPEYVEADHNKFSAKLVRAPSLDEVPYPVQMEPNLVVEYYSR